MRTRPIILNFDIEPEEFQTDRDNPQDWRGFEALVEILQEFRGRARAATKNPVHFNWYVRMDPQVEITYGRADWAFHRYERLFRILEREGDEIGLHTHSWRWNEERQQWIAEFADQAWIEHCVRRSFETYRACFGRPCESFRFGPCWLNNATVELLEQLGIRRDLSIEPGRPGGPATSSGVGLMPDLTGAPQCAYRPARGQFTQPGSESDRRDLWMIPSSTVDIHALQGPVRVDRTRPVRSGARLEGYLDGADTKEIFGWAWDSSRPNEPIAVDLYLDDQPWTSVWADEPRLDLLQAGKGNGRHAFRVSLPAKFRDDRSHVIRAQFAGRSQQLVGSPCTVVWPKNAPPTFHALDLCLRASYLKPWIRHLLAAGAPYISTTARTAVGVAEDREDALLATLPWLLELAQTEPLSFDTSADALQRLNSPPHEPALPESTPLSVFPSGIEQVQGCEHNLLRELEEKNDALSKLSARLLQQGRDLTERDDEIDRLRRERDHLVGQVAGMRASTSWKLMAPLRLLGQLRRGQFGPARHALQSLAARVFRRSPMLGSLRTLFHSSRNADALAAIVNKRRAPRGSAAAAPLCPPSPADWPAIDVGIVTHNSRRWIDGFVGSLLELNYPKDRIHLRFVDHESTDVTLQALAAIAPELQRAGFAVDVLARPNRGFGAGHNVAIRAGTAPFCLVTNIDLCFEPNALNQVVATALADKPRVAAWELRQKPYEHPKFYDPVTGLTNWNSHACVLLRRRALEAVGGYDDALFLYGEDVELSYRLRREGFLLRYCPGATVWHYCYEDIAQVKPLQYTGSTLANLYLRLKYGTWRDMAMVPWLCLYLLTSPQVYPGSRWHALLNCFDLLDVAPRALLSRRSSLAAFPFRGFDYEIIRDGAFVKQQSLPGTQPLVSVITRTYRGREVYLREALASVAHQTWQNIEHIIVEDGGETQRELVAEFAASSGRAIRFIASGKFGRSRAGNVGLANARGRWCLFLDDDDLLFADHVETLAAALLENENAVASYALAWEVVTDAAQLEKGAYRELTHQVWPMLRQEFDVEVLRHHNYLPIQTVLFERKLFEERGGFDEDMHALEDWTLWNVYAHDNRFVYVPKVTSLYRTPADPLKIRQRQKVLDDSYPLAQARIDRRINALVADEAPAAPPHIQLFRAA